MTTFNTALQYTVVFRGIDVKVVGYVDRGDYSVGIPEHFLLEKVVAADGSNKEWIYTGDDDSEITEEEAVQIENDLWDKVNQMCSAALEDHDDLGEGMDA